MQIFLLAFFGFIGLWPTVQQPSNWVEFKSLDGGFEAAMPAPPQTNTLAIQTSDGTLFTHIVSSNDHGVDEYMVSWTDYPAKSVEQRATEKTFGRMRDALIRHKEGKLLTETAASKEGYPARTITFSTKDRFVTVMFCFVKNRSYQLVVETKTDDARAVDRFFSSFRFLPAEPL